MRLGQWGAKYSTQEMERFIDACVDLGLLDFDHADIYGDYTSEAEFGEVLKRRKDLQQKLRHTTKCGIKMLGPNRPKHRIKSYDSSAAHIRWSVDNSLKQLGIDCIDLLLIHRPDYLLDANEVAGVFGELQKAGKVKAFGASNFTPSQFDLLNAAFPLVNHQVEISLLHTQCFEDGTLDQCQKLAVRPTAWSPLAGGRFFAKEKTETLKAIDIVLAELASVHNSSKDTILYVWLKNHPTGIVPITGSSKIERIKAAVAANEIALSREEWYRLWQAAKGREVA